MITQGIYKIEGNKMILNTYERDAVKLSMNLYKGSLDIIDSTTIDYSLHGCWITTENNGFIKTSYIPPRYEVLKFVPFSEGELRYFPAIKNKKWLWSDEKSRKAFLRQVKAYKREAETNTEDGKHYVEYLKLMK